MTLLISFFLFIARHARLCLVLGLVAGIFLQDLAEAMKPHLPPMVALLLFLSAVRIGPKAALGGLGDLRRTLISVLLLQLGLPLIVILVFLALGMQGNLFALAFLLMLSAPSITGNQNFAAIMGHDPAPLMRLLILGTALFPLTVIPTLWLVSGLGEFSAVLVATLRLVLVIGLAVVLGFFLRTKLLPEASADQIKAIDGANALLLSVIVIGLMSAVRPTLYDQPLYLLTWVIAVMVMNFGMQILTYVTTGSVDLGLVAGNHNVALFLVALPHEIVAPFLIFIGCYQVPMYLTPIVMDRLYRRESRKSG